jgi:hypothetical protein
METTNKIQVFKPIKTWFEELPEPYKSQAIQNSRNLDLTIDTIGAALLCAFMWSTSEQGYSYWQKLYTEITHNKNKQ